MPSSFSLRAVVPHAFLLGAYLLPTVQGICFSPGPAFPAPNLPKDDKRLAPLLAKLDTYFANVTSAETLTPWLTNKTSFAVQVTSSEETIWEGYHTAPLLGNYTDSAPTDVTGDTVFRIASISKTFTVYTLLRQNGIDLDDPVTKWLPELAEGGKMDGVQWKDISIRSLASQLSGISRETGWDDMAAGAGYLGLITDPINMGFPPVAEENLSPCMTNLIGDDDRPCDGQDILSVAKMRNPIFAPNFRSTYSNAAFSILGQVIERITGKSYEDSVKDAVTAPLGMTNTGVRKPKDSQGIIPDIKNNWETDIMAENPTAGIYSSPNDLSIYIRSILNSQLLTSSQINEWLKPHSWTADLNSAYGMPWEIFRTTKITSDNRAIDIYGKGGSLHGYLSEILIIPEFNIGITILVAGEFPALNDLIIDISTRVLREMDVALREDTRDRYAGVYSSPNLNSTIRVSVDKDGPGLLLKEWVSNGTDFYPIYASLKGAEFGIKDQSDGGEWQPRLIPTGLTQVGGGEVWRLILTKLKGEDTSGILFDNSCSTDVDTLMYGGISVEEFVFGISGQGKVEHVTLSAFRVELEHVEGQVGVGGGGEGDGNGNGNGNERFAGFEEYMTGYGIRYQRPIMAHA